MKSWSEDNPKAALMGRKQAVIVDAARRAFLETGYAETSMHRIAADAGVSIKTVYRHFIDKDELFSAVMEAACQTDGAIDGDGARSLVTDPEQEGRWLSEKPETALSLAGEVYLRHVLQPDQLSLYRIVTRDAIRFPELARRYREQVTDRQCAIFEKYLQHRTAIEGWCIHNPRYAANMFFAMLGAGLIDDALHGLRSPEQAEIEARVRAVTASMLLLLEHGVM
jgi:AcrR family transcriptional regulator